MHQIAYSAADVFKALKIIEEFLREDYCTHGLGITKVISTVATTPGVSSGVP